MAQIRARVAKISYTEAKISDLLNRRSQEEEKCSNEYVIQYQKLANIMKTKQNEIKNLTKELADGVKLSHAESENEVYETKAELQTLYKKVS